MTAEERASVVIGRIALCAPEVYERIRGFVLEEINAAVLAERDRCAKLVNEWFASDSSEQHVLDKLSDWGSPQAILAFLMPIVASKIVEANGVQS